MKSTKVTTLTWRALAKDGADLPAAKQIDMPAQVTVGPSETHDFALLVNSPGDLVLSAIEMVENATSTSTGASDRRCALTQPTGSFKLRRVTHKIHCLAENALRAGVVTASSDNH